MSRPDRTRRGDDRPPDRVGADDADGGSPEAMGRGVTLTMAIATGLAVANIYYVQPLLEIVEADLPGPATAQVATATQLGYAVGLFLLVPLSDVLERRRLIASQFGLLAAALGWTALAPGAPSLLAASFLVGVFSSVAQQIVPFAAAMAPPARRGAVVGSVMSGLLCGILLSRTLAGLVGAQFGWRAMFRLAVPLALAGAALSLVVLPRSRNDARIAYPALLRSLFALWRERPSLRLAALTQALMFAGFSAFWTTLSFELATPAYDLGARAAGTFGLVGIAGVLAAPLAGRIADARGPDLAITLGTLLMVAAWSVFALWRSVAGLVLGVIVMDFAVQAALVSNQHVIYAMDEGARARLNTVFMVVMFLGGAAGSAASNVAWRTARWDGVCALGLALALAATGIRLRRRSTGGVAADG